ncbi:hypothetical protein CKAN_01301300 [Cinnamomum micranthum f. kanehirae]|uniref:YTH domain-containing family protein n=1 Tax=Cinnamomum micranthum f. kanehirae TaxID=337451 RepID=A0A443P0A4_9MAGN|nr:hypothetical protein CKAN_01301300 [Cinnamomum micranthum f. kanehirae]
MGFEVGFDLDSADSLNILTLDAEERPADAGNLKEQPLSIKDERIVPPNVSHDVTTMGPPRDGIRQSGSLDAGGDSSAVYPPNVYAPQAQTFYYGGYENTSGEWDEYPQYVHAEGVEVGSPGIYNENSSLVFHTGYGYSPQMPYGPYSPVTTPMPSVRGDGQLYSPFTDPYYHQPGHPSMTYITPPSPMSQAELSMTTGLDHPGAFLGETPNSNGIPYRPRPGYTFPYGSFGRGNFAGDSGNPPFYDSRQGFGSGGPWSDWSKSSDGQRSLTPLSSPVASPQPIGTISSFGHNVGPLTAGMASPRQRPLYGFGSATSSYAHSYQHGGMHHQCTNFGGSVSALGTNARGWIAVDKGRRRGRGNDSLCSCTDTLDALIEQNRGPRASRPKNPSSERNSSADGKNGAASPKVDSELYNRSDFVTEHKDAKFFIIKSYSEDNVHKSIKYGVWASTPNGNKKLDAAYREAKEKEGICPVFLFFSVNASAQFCGVAEMTGPVDFDKSVDYWQQDKWSGQFPVKWHIIKDVPNSQFRHILLENNDNKPVTNSRDTQEVGLAQGLEMLNIFKNYDSEVSILDDFDFYEDRQKVMQERKARQQMIPIPISVAANNEARNPVPLSGDFIKQMSKSFAQAVRMEDSKDSVMENGRSVTAAATSADNLVKATVAVSTSQGN